jgi:DNA-binding transcriptional MerR regulator
MSMTADSYSAEQLSAAVNDWCQRHDVAPASGQAGQRMSVRNIRYYRALGLLDPPASGAGQGFGEKHRLQLIAIRLLQAQGLPLNRIQGLLFGRTEEELREVQKRALNEFAEHAPVAFAPAAAETWNITPLNDEFMLVSRKGRGIGPRLREQILSVIHGQSKPHRHERGTKGNKNEKTRL